MFVLMKFNLFENHLYFLLTMWNVNFIFHLFKKAVKGICTRTTSKISYDVKKVLKAYFNKIAVNHFLHKIASKCAIPSFTAH
ncbi:hypothetical protein ADM90_09095 [Lysinibacillus macroides]|uniref:Uncharacterized protein n=1 Tax=Lysinibacillus macroides TaxID=33935 RepID=A0A0M9DKQ1_9BACI|nr:hypothetical protein ADM90_09095 [Lysinibacillus macroides]